MGNKTKNILIVILLFVLAFTNVWFTNKNRKLKRENFKLENNIIALTDTVRITRTKINELEYSRRTFIVDRIQELEKLNAGLAAEVKNTKGKVVYLQGTQVIIKDTVEIPIVKIVKDSSGGFIADSHIDTTYSPGNYRIVDHQIRVLPGDTSSVFKEELGLAVITGLKKNEKKDYEIIFRSQFPGIRSIALEGAYIPRNQLKDDFKQKRFSFGFQLGYSPLTYDFDLKAPKLRNQISAGVGFNYRIF